MKATLTQDVLDTNPKDGEPYQPRQLDSRQEFLEFFDANVAAAKKLIAATSDEEFGKSWSLAAGGEARFTMPKPAVIRTWVLNHTIHHRGHLCVYLRLKETPFLDCTARLLTI